MLDKPKSRFDRFLVERFGITTGFHEGQLDIIEHLVRGRRVLAIQRTGWGKSLCYQVACLRYPYLTVVFSPLKALMRDQCQRCEDGYEIPSAIVSSDFEEEENEKTLKNAASGKLKLLFIAPERLRNELWQRYVLQMRISMIVIDEAHCISTWGHDFRPDYQRIVKLLNAIPAKTPVLALTATANQRVESDILAQMGEGVQVVRGTMIRPNLHLQVVQVNGDDEKLCYIAQALPTWEGTGLIYTATQRDAEFVATFLTSQGVVAEYYHAGREDATRQIIEYKLMNNHYKVVCSTNALGMGIDKRDIRFIVHYHVPASPIHYYQEMGRAGRDGNSAQCVLLYDPADMAIQEHFVRIAKPEGKQYTRVLELLRSVPQGLRESDLMRRTGMTASTLRKILVDLEDQALVERQPKGAYVPTVRTEEVDFSAHDIVRAHKLDELNDIRKYAGYDSCYMEYLATYLGDQPGTSCGACAHCLPSEFPLVEPSESVYSAVTQFLERDSLPLIEMRTERRGFKKLVLHENGYSLSYYGTSRLGKLVKEAKHTGMGTFAEVLVTSAVEVIRERYPIQQISGIVCVPPTKSGTLVEDFAQRVAAQLGISYLSVLNKVRVTREQRECTNWRQKQENVGGAFRVQSAELVRGRTLLLIDDICDSGHTLRAVGQALVWAGARAVYPFTIARTRHAEDQ